MQGTRHVLFLQVWSFWYLVKLKPVVHPIREDLQSCSMPTCGLTGYGPARSCILELNPAVVSVFHQLVPHWSPISCVLPFVGRLGPACAKIGLGFAVVGWFRRFCPPPPPSAGLGLSPSASAFLFPCLFRVCPLRARCVGVGVFSFPLPFAFPLFVSRLSNSHFIFMFTSPSSFFILTFTSSSEFTPCLAGCVCVEHLNRCKTSHRSFQSRGAVVHSAVTA